MVEQTSCLFGQEAKPGVATGMPDPPKI